jgi:hypothetical protein
MRYMSRFSRPTATILATLAAGVRIEDPPSPASNVSGHPEKSLPRRLRLHQIPTQRPDLREVPRDDQDESAPSIKMGIGRVPAGEGRSP